MNEARKAEPTEAGCWVDGHWGQYAVARMVQTASWYGYADEAVLALADRDMHSCDYPSDDSQTLTDDESEILSDACGEVVEWLDANVAPDRHYFEWFEGEFFMRKVFDLDAGVTEAVADATSAGQAAAEWAVGRGGYTPEEAAWALQHLDDIVEERCDGSEDRSGLDDIIDRYEEDGGFERGRIEDAWCSEYQIAFEAELGRIARYHLDATFDRFDIAKAYSVWAHDYADYGDPYWVKVAVQLRRIGFRPSSILSYSTLTANGVAIYEALVARLNGATLVGA